MKPPPQAGPCTHAMNTCWSRRIFNASSAMWCWPRSDSETVPPPAPGSFRSRPAQKPRPAPRNTTTRTEGSSFRSS